MRSTIASPRPEPSALAAVPRTKGVAGFTIRVFAGPFAHGTAGLNDEFAAEFACAFAQFGIVVHIEHQLGNAVAVAQVDEGKAAQVAADGYPAGQGHFFIDIRKA